MSDVRAAVLDAGALTRLRELDPSGRGRVVERVLEAFEGSATRLSAELAAAAEGGDRIAVGHVAHTLKSSSASIGATRVSRLCAEIEAEVREGTAVDLGSRAALLLAELRVVLQAIEPLQGKTAPP